MKRYNERFPTVVVDSSGDVVNKQITFQSTWNTVGEVVIGKLYDLEAQTLVKTVTDGSVSGVKKNGSITLTIDVSSVDSGSYGLKLYTVETGVIAKTIVVVK